MCFVTIKWWYWQVWDNNPWVFYLWGGNGCTEEKSTWFQKDWGKAGKVSAFPRSWKFWSQWHWQVRNELSETATITGQPPRPISSFVAALKDEVIIRAWRPNTEQCSLKIFNVPALLTHFHSSLSSLTPWAVRETGCLLKFNGIHETTKTSEERKKPCTLQEHFTFCFWSLW